MWFSESRGKEPKDCVMVNEVKAAVTRKEAVRKKVLTASDEEAK